MDNSNNNKPQVPPQPQFQQAPQHPQVQQPQPQQPVIGTPYQMPPKKKMSKGAAWGIIGGIVGLVVIILGVVLAVLLLSGPSKADYKDLLSQFTGLDVGDAFISENGAGARNTKDKIYKAIEKINDLNKKMSSHRALRDKDVKAAYDKYVDSWNNGAREYLDFLAILTEDKTYEKCKSPDVSKYLRESKENFETKDCIDYLDKMSKSENKLASKYGKDWKNYYTEMKQYYVAIVEYAKNTKSRSSLPKAPKTPKIDFNTDAVEKWKKAIDDFEKVLEEKANK